MKKIITLLFLAALIGCGGSSTSPDSNGSGNDIIDQGDNGNTGDNLDNGDNADNEDQGGQDTQKELTPEEILAKLKEDGNASYDVNAKEYLKGTWTVYLFPNEYLGVTQEPQDIVIDEDGYTPNHNFSQMWHYRVKPYVYNESHFVYDNCSDMLTNYPEESQDIIEVPGNGPILFDYKQQIRIIGINDPQHELQSFMRGITYDYCCSNQVDGCADYDLQDPAIFEETKSFQILGINNASKQRAFYVEYDHPHPQTPVYEILFVRQD